MKSKLKSKLGAVLGALYLILALALLLGMIFGGGGPHGAAGTCFIFLILLTTPWSWFALSTMPSTNGAPPDGGLESLIIIVGMPFGALINAAALYFMGWLASLILSSLFSKSEKPLK